ncbi:MAG: zinc ribbon domain-containing protein [Culicoidibacterales bacterium]
MLCTSVCAHSIRKYESNKKGSQSVKTNNIIKLEQHTKLLYRQRVAHCGVVKTRLSLSERTFDCKTCHLTIDRTLNAAINLTGKQTVCCRV